MQKKSFLGLMYKDWYLGKKTFKTDLILSLVFSLLGIVIVLSMNYGNLRLVQDGEVKEVITLMMMMYVKYMPLFGFASLGMSVLGDFVKIENRKWRMFRITTPVSVYRYAGAKYVLAFGVSLVGIILSLIYSGLILVITDGKFSTNDIAVIFLMGFAGSFLMIVMGIFVQLFGSQDKGGLALCGIIFVIIVILSRYLNKNGGIPGVNMEGMDIASNLKNIENFLGHHVGTFILLYFGIYIFGYLVTTLIYKRREK